MDDDSLGDQEAPWCGALAVVGCCAGVGSSGGGGAHPCHGREDDAVGEGR